MSYLLKNPNSSPNPAARLKDLINILIKSITKIGNKETKNYNKNN